MAELDLKDIWKKGEATLSKSRDFDVLEVIGKSSKTVLQKILFVLKIEFWLNIVLTPASGIYYFLYFGKGWGIFVGVLFFVYFFYYLFLMRSIKGFDYSGDVRQSLSKVYNYLKFFLLHYKVVIWICFAVIPYIMFIYGFYIGYTGATPPEWIAESTPEKVEMSKQQAYIFMAIVAIVPALVAALFHYLASLIYGKKIAKLKAIIKDLD